VKPAFRRLLVVEDEHLVALFLKEVLEDAGFEVKVAEDAAEAIKIAKTFDPDIAVLDINLGEGPSGVELAFILDRKYPGIALLILTRHPDLRTAGYGPDDIPEDCGFLRKDLVNDSSFLTQAIEDVISRKSKVRQDEDPSRPLGALSAHQIEILRMAATGLTNAAIASHRKTSSRAVEQSLRGIYSSLGIEVDGDLNPRVEAVRMFIAAAGVPKRPLE
jgi:DNA-binding NarL/FixJ family response regulator